MNKPVSVDLGDSEDRARALVESGQYPSLDAVVQAGIAALALEDAAETAWLKAKIAEALADPRPPVSMEEAFARVRAAAAARR